MATFSPHIRFYCSHQLSYLSPCKVFFAAQADHQPAYTRG